MKERIDSDSSLIEEEAKEKLKWWQKMKCCKGNKVGDSTTSCFPKRKRRGSWVARTEMFDATQPKKRLVLNCELSTKFNFVLCCFSAKDVCKNFFRRIFCLNWCASRKRRKEEEEAAKRRASMMSKKKSLTPQAPPEVIIVENGFFL